MISKISAFGVAFLLMQQLLAQNVQVEDRYDDYFAKQPSFFIDFRNDIGQRDWTLGMTTGIRSASGKFAGFVNFDARPFRKAITEYQGSNLWYQYQEERYYIGVGGEYLHILPDQRFGPFLQVNVNYTWGTYGGTQVKAENGWVVNPRGGLAYLFGDRNYLKVGYANVNTKNIEQSRHRIFLGVSFTFKSNQ